MKYLIVLLCVFSLSAVAIEDQSTLCTYGTKERKIDLVYPEQTELPCEIQYTKNATTKTLWTAAAEVGFCEGKYKSFVEKQTSWGWKCAVVPPAQEQSEELQEAEDESMKDDMPVESQEEQSLEKDSNSQ